MTKLFTPKVSMPAAPAPAPTVATPDVEAAAESERRRARTASGKASTMLTSQESYTAPTVSAAKLLGG